MRQLILSIFVFSCFSTQAAPLKAASLKEIKKVASTYYIEKILKLNASEKAQVADEICPPPGQPEPGQNINCMETICEKIGSWNCDSQSEISAVAAVCSDQYNGACIDNTCSKIGSWNCDSLSEIKTIANTCKGIYNPSCIDNICSKIGSWNCDSLSEIQTITATCQNVGIETTGCIEFTCNKIGSWNCDSLSEIQNVIRSCKGQ